MEMKTYILRADGQIIYEADTEEELWGWVAVNLPDVVFWDTSGAAEGA